MGEFDIKPELGDPSQTQLDQAEEFYKLALKAKKIEQGFNIQKYDGELSDLKHKSSDLYTLLSTAEWVIEGDGEDKGSIARVIDPVGKDLADQVINLLDLGPKKDDKFGKFVEIFNRDSENTEDKKRRRHLKAEKVLRLHRLQRSTLNFEEKIGQGMLVRLPPIESPYKSNGINITSVYPQIVVDREILMAIKKSCYSIYTDLLDADEEGKRFADLAIKKALSPWESDKKRAVEEAEKIIFGYQTNDKEEVSITGS